MSRPAQVGPTPELQLRGRAADLVGFATSQWMHNGRDALHVQGVPRPVYDHHQHATLERLWNDPRVSWLFAAHPPDPNFVFGFLVGEHTNQGPILHWLLVRKHWRRFGIARALLDAFAPAPPFVEGEPAELPRAYYTSNTAPFRRLVSEAESDPVRRWEWVYNPWLLWEPTFR